MNIVEKGYQQRIGDLEQIARDALEALAVIALSYRVRIDKSDKAPYEHAQDVLEELGIDLELTAPHLDQAMQYLGWKD